MEFVFLCSSALDALASGHQKNQDRSECVIAAMLCDGSKWRQSIWAGRRWDYLLVWKDKQPTEREKSITKLVFPSTRHFEKFNFWKKDRILVHKQVF